MTAREPDTLLRGVGLHQAQRWLEVRGPDLTEKDRHFILASLGADRYRRRFRTLALIGVLVGVVSLELNLILLL